MWQQTKIDVFGDERCERGKASAEGEQNLKQSVESVLSVFQTILTLETATVKPDVPVGCVVDELQ